MNFTIHIPEKVSLNQIYAGVHFRERMRHKEAYFYAIKEAKIAPWQGLYPVHVKYHFKLKGTPLDIDNHVYMAKMVLDSLVAAEIIPGDDQTYVSAITITAEKIKKGEPDVVEVSLEARAA